VAVVENGKLMGVLRHGNLVQATSGKEAAKEATVGETERPSVSGCAKLPGDRGAMVSIRVSADIAEDEDVASGCGCSRDDYCSWGNTPIAIPSTLLLRAASGEYDGKRQEGDQQEAERSE
jgi:hypothetical protein